MKMLCIALLIALGLTTVALAKFQKDLDPEQWSEIRANPYYCALHQNDGCTVQIQITPKREVEIVFTREKLPPYTLKCEPYTVFAISGNSLWYARYNNTSTGGTVICIDLATGNEKWNVQLQALSVQNHHSYGNSINLLPTEKGIQIIGHETFGDYIEIVDSNSGKQLSHKIISKNPK